MDLNKKQRVFIIKKLATEIDNMDRQDGLLFLEEYTKQIIKEREDCHSFFEDFSFSYHSIIRFIQGLEDITIFEMYKDLFSEDVSKEFLEKKHLYRLPTDKLVVFFSHSKNVKLVLDVKFFLEKTDWIECFVAHEDIKEGKEGWIEEIKRYLECCHCLIAFLSEDFKSSPYCDQELGVAIHRQIPIFPVKMDSVNPYGFIQHIQATAFNRNRDIEVLSNKIESWLLDEKENPRLYNIAKPKLNTVVQTLTNNLLNSTNTQMANSVLEQLMMFKSAQINNYLLNEIQKNWKQNSKIKEVKNINKKMEDLFQKHPKKISTAKQESHKQNSHKKGSLNNEKKLQIDINLREVLKRRKREIKEEELPF